MLTPQSGEGCVGSRRDVHGGALPVSGAEPDTERRAPSAHARSTDDAHAGDHELGVARSRAERAKRRAVALGQSSERSSRAQLDSAGARHPIARDIADDEAIEALLVCASHGSKS
jgi:hypothetical protein